MSLWDEEKLKDEEIDFLEFEKDGTPCYFKVVSWKDTEHTFLNPKGVEFTGSYIKTDGGLLRINSIRLRRELKPFLNTKAKLILQCWKEDGSNYNHFYKVSKFDDTAEISNKRS